MQNTYLGAQDFFCYLGVSYQQAPLPENPELDYWSVLLYPLFHGFMGVLCVYLKYITE